MWFMIIMAKKSMLYVQKQEQFCLVNLKGTFHNPIFV